MNKAKYLLWTILGLLSIFTSLHGASLQTGAAAPLGSSAFVTVGTQEILNATIQIRLYPEGTSTGENNQLAVSDVQYYERGFGTILDQEGDLFILTHDHWSLVDSAGVVQFRNSLGELLLEIPGEAFRELVRYRDGGTMILLVPVELRPDYLDILVTMSKANFSTSLSPAEMGNQNDLGVGDVVMIARQCPGNAERVDLLTAAIESVENREGLPVFKLKSQTGEAIVPGDSGGGVWLNNQLIGNIWISEYIYDWRFWTWESLNEPVRKRLDTSIAAQVPIGLEKYLPEESLDTSSQSGQFTSGEPEL